MKTPLTYMKNHNLYISPLLQKECLKTNKFTFSKSLNVYFEKEKYFPGFDISLRICEVHTSFTIAYILGDMEKNRFQTE